MRILISGSTGLIGSHLFQYLKDQGSDVIPLVRSRNDQGIYWNPKRAKIQKEAFEGFDAIIHLAAKNIASGLWTEKLKDEIFQSRCRDTWLLSQVLNCLKTPPKIFIVASAVGYYGSRGDETLTEESSSGEGFLATVCKEWEKVTSSVEKRGVRVVHTRFGVVLSPKGGALKRLLIQFGLGLGAILGSGQQYISWVALEDVLSSIDFILNNQEITGPVNIVSPFPETMASFSKKLASALNRPLFLRVGERALKWVMGEMAEEMLLASVRAVPRKLIDSGYHFQFEKLEECFKAHLE